MYSSIFRISSFLLWFSIIGTIFLLLLFGLRKSPQATSIDAPCLLKTRNVEVQAKIPFRFSEFEIPAHQKVSLTWNINVDDVYESPAILVERPLYHIQVFWDETLISDSSNFHPGQGRMLVLSMIPNEKIQIGPHLLRIDVVGENEEGGILEQLWIGEAQDFIFYIQRRAAAGIFLASILLFASIFSLIRFVIYPKKSQFLTYGFLFFAFLLVSFSGVDLWYIFFSSIEWQLRIKTISILWCFSSSSLILRYISNLDAKKAQRLSLVFVLISIFPLLPISLSSLQLIRFSTYFIAPLYMIFVIWLFSHSLKEKNPASLVFLMFGSLLIVGGILDIFAIFGYSQLPPSMPLFSSLFSIGITIYLSLEDSQLAIRYEQMIIHAPDPILVLDSSGVITESNPIAHTKLGLYNNINLFSYCSTKSELKQHLENPLSHNQTELNIQYNDQTFVIDSIAVSLTSETKLLVLRDITDRKNMEEKVLRTTKLETMGLLSSGIAHDFNNMLTAIMGHLTLIRPYIPNTEVHRINILDHLVLNTSSSIQRILSLARGGSDIGHPHRINNIIIQALEISKGMLNKQIIVHNHLCSSNPSILISATDFHQVLINLLLNAKEACPKGIGEIWIETKTKDNHVYITIEDSGPGISPEIADKIFTPFFTTKENFGTGLGLAVCQRVITNYQGTIRLIPSSKQTGATFEISFPIQTSENNMSLVSSRDKNILLVEDEYIILHMMKDILTQKGWNVTPARSAQEARNKWKPNTYQILITDVIMPEESGLELAHSIQKRDPNISIIIVSGYIPANEEQLLPKWRQIHKPFSKETLLQQIDNITT